MITRIMATLLYGERPSIRGRASLGDVCVRVPSHDSGLIDPP